MFQKLDKHRLQASCVTAMLLLLLLISVKHLMLPQEDYVGNLIYKYQATPVMEYALLSVLICGIIVWKGKIKDKRLSKISAVLSFCIMPFLAFYVFERISGNFHTIMENRIEITILNLCIWHLLYAVVFAVSNHIRITLLLTNSAIYLLAVANAFVVQFRKQPIMLMDIKSFFTAMSVAGEFQYHPTMEMILMGLLILLCNLWIIKMDFKFSGWKKRASYILFTTGCTGFLFYGMLKGDLLEKAGFTGLNFFRFDLTYQTSGYLLSTVDSLRYLYVEEPEGYSVERVKSIAENAGRETVKPQRQPKNLIVVMNESFSDLSVLGEFQTSEPMLPYFSQMTDEAAKGYVYTSVFGGATANSEFEFLTGNSMAYVPAGTVAYQMYVDEGDSSIVSILKNNGYRTVAYHPYRKDNYNRPSVYQIYGFDEYYGRGGLKTKKLRKYASDQSNYKKIIQLYEEKAEGEKLFLFNITMQNHGGYDEENYESSVSLTEYAGQFPQTEQFLSLMQESDKAFHELLEYFSQVEEDTVILLFGDHQPSLEDDFYEQVMEPETPENFLSRYQKRFLTPYVLWANYDLKAEEEKYLSLNYLGSYLLDAIGLELPVYNRYLLNLQKKIPAINLNGFLDETYQMRGLPGDGEYQELLQQYQFFQYHNMFEDKRRIKELFELTSR